MYFYGAFGQPDDEINSLLRASMLLPICMGSKSDTRALFATCGTEYDDGSVSDRQPDCGFGFHRHRWENLFSYEEIGCFYDRAYRLNRFIEPIQNLLLPLDDGE